MARKTIAEIFKAAPDTVFYIGAESGFFFIGNAKTFKRCKDKINRRCHDIHDSKQIAAKKNLPNILNDIVKLTNENKIDRNACAARIATLSKTVDTIATPWVDIWDRTPVEVCEKDAEEGYAIKVIGLEEGKFWAKNEFDNVFGGY